MTLEQAKAMAEAVPDLRVRESYSGRGMYGKTTAAVVGSLEDIMDAAKSCGIDRGELAYDQMGKRDVIAY